MSKWEVSHWCDTLHGPIKECPVCRIAELEAEMARMEIEYMLEIEQLNIKLQEQWEETPYDFTE